MRMKDQQRFYQMRKDEEELQMMRRMRDLEEERDKLKKVNEALLAERGRLHEKTEEQFATPEDPRRKGEEGKEAEEPEGKGKEEMTNMTLRLMMKMMEQMIQRDEEKKEHGGGLAETVRYGTSTIPALPEWNSQSAPLDLGDWLTLIDSHMGDLSATSHEWWTKVNQEAPTWYFQHQILGPLEKVTHKPEPSPELRDPRWARLERRASGMLLSALPDSQKDEMIATKSLSPLAILARLMVAYQPGGLAEKGIILRALEQPDEAQSLPQSLTMLRRWLRWKRRAEDVGVTMPDPSILIRGLNKMMRKVLEGNRELNFRISLAKTNLMVESNPKESTVQQLAEHLVAEVEQIAHLDPNKSRGETRPVVKKVEEGGERMNRGAKVRSETKREEVCRYFTTEAGCRKGRACRWSHVMDDQRRCWCCGAKDHFASSCPRKDAEKSQERGSPDRKGGDGGKGGPRAAKVVRKDEESPPTPTDQTSSNPASSSQKEDPGGEKQDAMKELLEEANKMLRMLHKDKGGMDVEKGRESKLERLQQQLDDLKSLKVFRVAKIQQGSLRRTS